MIGKFVTYDTKQDSIITVLITRSPTTDVILSVSDKLHLLFWQ